MILLLLVWLLLVLPVLVLLLFQRTILQNSFYRHEHEHSLACKVDQNVNALLGTLLERDVLALNLGKTGTSKKFQRIGLLCALAVDC